MTAPIEVTRTIAISAPPQRVWDIIAKPEKWTEWRLVPPAVEAGRPLEVGSEVAWRDGGGAPYLRGTVTRLDVARQLTLELSDASWQRQPEPGEVTYRFTLAPEGAGTRLDFALGDLSIDAEADDWAGAYAGSRELEAIKEMAEAR